MTFSSPSNFPFSEQGDRHLQEQARQHFGVEAPELLQAIEQGLLDLAEGHSIPTVHSLMRAAHTLKGSSASVGLTSIQDLAHEIEDIFRALYDPNVPLDGEVQLLLLQAADGLKFLVEVELSGQGDPSLGIALMDQMSPVLEQLRERLGDPADAEIPTSVELGFDITQSIFESGVAQRLQELESALEAGDPVTLMELLATHADVFVGLAESLTLPGLAQIATLICQAIERDPSNIMAIATIALRDLRQSQSLVLAGDRHSGGDPSPELLDLAGEVSTLSISAPEQTSIPFQPELPDPLGVWDVEINGWDDPDDIDEISDPQESVWDDSPLNTDALTTLASPESEVDFLPVQPQDLPIAKQEPALPLESAPSLEEIEEIEEAAPSVPDSISKPSLNTALQDSLTRLQALAVLDSLSTEVVVAPQPSSPPLQPIQPAPTAPDPVIPLAEQIWFSVDATDDATEQEALNRSPAAEIQPEEMTLSGDPWALVALQQQSQPQSQLARVEPLPQPAQSVVLSPRSVESPETTKSETPEGSARMRADTVRVDVGLLQQLDTRIGDLLISQNQQANTGETLQETLRAFQTQLVEHLEHLGQLQPLSDQMWMPEASCLLPTPSAFNQNSDPPSHQPGWGSSPSDLAQDFDALELDRYTDLQLLMQSLLAQGSHLQALGDTLQQVGGQLLTQLESQNRLLSRVRDDVITARMVPLEDLFNRFPRMMRELALTHHKPADLILQGGHVLIDKGILEKLYEPLLHLLRNAFDHGIEPPDLRQSQGKSSKGQIHLTATTQGGQAVIEVRDDGRGLNWERIRQKAMEKGLLDPHRARSEAELRQVLFAPGFSTAEQVSDLSGRGVGLDVVREQLVALKGSITVHSQANQGTTFSLKIPLTLSVAKLLVCGAGSRRYAFWVDGIEQILLPTSGQILQSGSHRLLRLGQHLIPIRRLDQLFSHHYPLPETLPDSLANRDVANPDSSVQPTAPLLLLRHPRTPLAVEIDQLVGEQELVIKPLSPTITAPTYVYGASLMGDGGLLLVLEGIALVDQVLNRSDADARPNMSTPVQPVLPAAASVPVRPSPRILVIDDSVTLRQTLAQQLKQAGLQVLTAEDGQDALDQLRHNPDIQGILCDIEMPRMNGFQFLSQAQQDPVLSRIPVWMLTSRQSEKHRRLAKELGATAYLTKPYDPRVILDALSSIISVPA